MAIDGDGGDNVLVGDSSAQQINGYGGADILIGNGGFDALKGDDGDDILVVGQAEMVNGSLVWNWQAGIGQGLFTVAGGSGFDTLYLSAATSSSLKVFAQDGVDNPNEGGNWDVQVDGHSTVGAVLIVDPPVRGLERGYIHGSAGDDVLRLIGGDDRLWGGAGNDTLDGAGGDNILYGEDGDDWLGGGVGNNVLDGGAGNDTIQGGSGAAGAGNDLIDGGTGYDRLLFSGSYAITVDLRLATPQVVGAQFGTDTILGIEEVQGGSGNDTIHGGAANEHLVGGDGDDVLNGGDGADTLFDTGLNDVLNGGAGDDVLSGALLADGGTGDDTVSYQGFGSVSVDLRIASAQQVASGRSNTLSSIENLIGSDAADRLIGTDADNQLEGRGGDDVLQGELGNDRLDGGEGFDVASYLQAASAVTIDLRLSGAQNTDGAGVDTLISIEDVYGSQFNDRVWGTDGENYFFGLSGDDALRGNGGDDLLDGGAGGDLLDGGDGSDLASFYNAVAAVTVDLRYSAPQNTDGAGVDTLISIENLAGSNFDDRLWGDAGDNQIQGAGGADTLYGEDGDDLLYGEDGDDWLYANVSGSDVLSGGGGDDHLTVRRALSGTESVVLSGGEGRDEFVIGVSGGDPSTWPVYALGGADNDIFRLIGGETLLYGEAGQDTFRLDSADFAISGQNLFYIADFEAGNAGDRIDLSGALGRLSNWGGGNPFADGHFRVVQENAVALVQLDADGGGDQYVTLFALHNLSASALTTYNFSGIDPTGAVTNSGDDVLVSSSGVDNLDGGTGNDTADYSSAASYVTVDLRSAAQQNTDGGGLDTLTSIENVIGSNYDDRLWGNSVGNKLYGMGGDDQLDGGLGNDTLDGGSGFDTANYGSATSYVTIDLDYGSVQNTDAAGLDTFASIERVIGGNYDDRFWGSDANNFLHGGIGQDQLNGRGGEDLLDGGANHDILTGGSGPDVFVFRSTSDTHWDAPDRITDFAPGDRIDIGDIDADTSVGGDQAFHIATQPEAAGVYISYDAGSNRTTLRLDTNGDGNPDGRIWLDGDHRGLINADFVL